MSGRAEAPIEVDSDQTPESVGDWLLRIGCDEDVRSKFAAQNFTKPTDMKYVVKLSEQELKEDIGIETKGDRMRILDASNKDYLPARSNKWKGQDPEAEESSKK